MEIILSWGQSAFVITHRPLFVHVFCMLGNQGIYSCGLTYMFQLVAVTSSKITYYLYHLQRENTNSTYNYNFSSIVKAVH